MKTNVNLKFYIFQDETYELPLTWDNKAIQFDTKEEAEFFNSCIIDEEMRGIIFECILYYDDGMINFKDIPNEEIEEDDCLDEDIIEFHERVSKNG